MRGFGAALGTKFRLDSSNTGNRQTKDIQTRSEEELRRGSRVLEQHPL